MPSIDLSDMRLRQRRNISRSWRGMSINEQIIIRPLTSVDRVLRKRSILKKGDIIINQVLAKTRTRTSIPLLNSRVSRNQVLAKTRTITSKPLLNSRVTKEDALQ